jgi:6-phosphogluconolactonase (cycloisomerase 2 family)
MAFDLINKFNITDAVDIDGPVSFATGVVGGNHLLFTAEADGHRLTVFKILANGHLQKVQTVVDNGVRELDDVNGVTTAVIAGKTFVLDAAQDDDGISSFQVANNGHLVNKDNVDNDDDLDFLLDGANGIATAVVAGKTFVFVTGVTDGAVSSFQLFANNGLLLNKDIVPDAGALEISSARAVTTTTIGSTTLLFVAGIVDDGISSFKVNADGTLDNQDNLDNADIAGLELNGVDALTTAKVGDKTFLFSASSVVGDSGVSVFDIDASGDLHNNVFNLPDDGTLNLDGGLGITTTKIAGITYLFVSAFQDDGFSAFVVAADGSLINVANVTDDDDPTNLQLVDAHGISTAKVGSNVFLFVGGRQDDGISVFKIKAAGLTINGGFGNDIIDATHSAAGQALPSGLGDKIFGNIGTDTINGLGGDDFIDGGAGQDFYKGAKGADRFVFSLATDTAVGATRDVIQDFHHNQHDRINLAAIDAKEGPAGNQAFHFIGHHQFSGKAGELRFAKHVVSGDTDGDGIADFQIGIVGNVDLVKADFVL